jgi:hypothetical protein
MSGTTKKVIMVAVLILFLLFLVQLLDVAPWR